MERDYFFKNYYYKPVRVHILDPAALATSSQALMSFWPYGDVRVEHVTKPKYFLA